MALRIGCVSYLNSKPLVWGLAADPDLRIVYDVPARLLDLLERDGCDVALLPAIDYQRADDLVMVPSACIGADGPVYTVRLYARVPCYKVRKVFADIESHTSVALCRILLHFLHGQEVTLVEDRESADAVLLIGDKVVTAAPREFIYQMDLADAWKQWTGLPFVFATWMTRRGRDIADVPQKLKAAMLGGMDHIDEIVAAEAEAHGWPSAMAHHYFKYLMKFPIDLSDGAPQRKAIELFHKRAFELGVVSRCRGIEVYGS